MLVHYDHRSEYCIWLLSTLNHGLRILKACLARLFPHLGAYFGFTGLPVPGRLRVLISALSGAFLRLWAGTISSSSLPPSSLCVQRRPLYFTLSVVWKRFQENSAHSPFVLYMILASRNYWHSYQHSHSYRPIFDPLQDLHLLCSCSAHPPRRS